MASDIMTIGQIPHYIYIFKYLKDMEFTIAILSNMCTNMWTFPSVNDGNIMGLWDWRWLNHGWMLNHEKHGDLTGLSCGKHTKSY